LLDLRQFLEEMVPNGEQPEDEPHYRLYHQSVVDFLRKRSFRLDEHTCANPYYLQRKNPSEDCGFLPASDQPWHTTPAAETYFWYHFPYHLSEAEQQDELRKCWLNFGWFQAKLMPPMSLPLSRL
jgi:hypothetical protein